MDFDARTVLEHALGVFLDYSRRQAEGGDAPDHHAAEPVGGLIDVDRVAGLGEVLGSGEPGRAGTDDAHGLGPGDRHRRQVMVAPELLHDEALEVADGDRAVGGGAPARRLARGVAHPPADRAERVCRGDRLVGLLEFLLPDVGEIGRGVGADGAGDLARRGDEVQIVGVVDELGRHDQVYRRGDSRMLISRDLTAGGFMAAVRLVREPRDRGGLRRQRHEVVA